MLPYPSSPEFPAALKARRELRGMSRSALARAAGIHEVMPRRYEEPKSKDFTKPRADSTWIALNRALGYEIDENAQEFVSWLQSMGPVHDDHTHEYGPEDQAEAEDQVAATGPTELLLKDATLEDIVAWLHARNIEPTFCHIIP